MYHLEEEIPDAPSVLPSSLKSLGFFVRESAGDLGCEKIPETMKHVSKVGSCMGMFYQEAVAYQPKQIDENSGTWDVSHWE